MSDWISMLTRSSDRAAAKKESAANRKERSLERLMGGIKGIGDAFQEQQEFGLEKDKFGLEEEKFELDEKRFQNDKEYREKSLQNEADRIGISRNELDQRMREFGYDHDEGTDQDIEWEYLKLAQENARRAAEEAKLRGSGAGGGANDENWRETVKASIEMAVGTQMEATGQDFYEVLKDPNKATALRANLERILNNEPGFEEGSQSRADALAVFDTMVRQAKDETPIPPDPDKTEGRNPIPQALLDAWGAVKTGAGAVADGFTAAADAVANSPITQGIVSATPGVVDNFLLAAAKAPEVIDTVAGNVNEAVDYVKPLVQGGDEDFLPPQAEAVGIAIEDVLNSVDTFMNAGLKNDISRILGHVETLKSNANLTEADVRVLNDALAPFRAGTPTDEDVDNLERQVKILANKGRFSTTRPEPGRNPPATGLVP